MASAAVDTTVPHDAAAATSSSGGQAVPVSIATSAGAALAPSAHTAPAVVPYAPSAPSGSDDPLAMHTLEADRSSDGDGEQSERLSEGCSEDSMDSEGEDQLDEEGEDVDVDEDADEFPDVDQEEEPVKEEILLLAGVEIEAEPEPAPAPSQPSQLREDAVQAPARAAPAATPSDMNDDEAFSPVQSPCFHHGGTYPDQNLPPKTGIAIPMISTSPSFIRTVPEEPELLYAAPDNLFDDIVKAEADRISRPENVRNKIVFDSVGDPGQQSEASNYVAAVPPGGFPAADQDMSSSRDGLPPGPGHRPQMAGVVSHLPPYYSPDGADDRTLVFESRFESGNLRRAVQAYEFEYDLILNPDYNTKSHTQWYFFRVSNTRKGPSYRFNILNMVKPTSVYNEGMRPLQYSCIEAATKGAGWVRCGEKIAYYQNGLRRHKGSNYYTLTFTVTFEHDCDEVYFSHCYPYTYTDLQMDMRALDKDPNMVRRFRRRKLCETLAGNACDLITITSFSSDPEALKARRAVVITARVHPGESNASWVMKGMLDYLTGASVDARILRDNFVFKIVPMMNPDGVIVGNYRCSLAGQDLNRLWDEPSRKMHPTIFFAKSMFRHLMDDREVILYVDIHGHSRKKNVFMYGNSENNSLREKIFPGLLCRSSDCFSFDDCCFKIQKSKESTARVVAYRELGVSNSFTLEASFCGADFGPLGDQHFTTRHLEEMGYMVCDAILDFCDPDQTKVMLVCKELQVLFPDDGNSDDVSDSEDDGAAAMRRKKRAAQRAKKDKQTKPPPKKKKVAAKSESSRAKADGDTGGGNDEDKKVSNKEPKEPKEPKAARNTRRKSQRRDPPAASPADEPLSPAVADAAAPEVSDAEQGGEASTAKRQKSKKKKVAAAKSRGSVTTRDSKDSKATKSQKARGGRSQRGEGAETEPLASSEQEEPAVGPESAGAVLSEPSASAVEASLEPPATAYRPAGEDVSVPLPLDVAASAAGITPASPEPLPTSLSCYPAHGTGRQPPSAPYP